MTEPLPANVIPFHRKSGSSPRHSTRGKVADPQAVLDEWDELAQLRGFANMAALMTALLLELDHRAGRGRGRESGRLSGVQYREP